MKQQTTRNVLTFENSPVAAVACPKCGRVASCTLPRYGKVVVTCDSEEGGCDTPFVIEIAYLEVGINTYDIN